MIANRRYFFPNILKIKKAKHFFCFAQTLVEFLLFGEPVEAAEFSFQQVIVFICFLE